MDGLTDGETVGRFQAARRADDGALAAGVRRARDPLRGGAKPGEVPRAAEAEPARRRRRPEDLRAIDFFGAPAHAAAAGLIDSLGRHVAEPRRTSAPEAARVAAGPALRARTGVTRAGVLVDRMASAWLIRRFIDPEARSRLVPSQGYRPLPDEVRVNLFEAEVLPEGDRCTFEVLRERFGLGNAALRAVAEIVHEIDLEDPRFARPETAGIDHLVAAIATAHREDETRLDRGAAVFGDLYEYFRRKA